MSQNTRVTAFIISELLREKKRDILIVSLSFSFSLIQINLILLPHLDRRLISFGEKQ